MLTFFERGVETATKFYETQHSMYTHSPHPLRRLYWRNVKVSLAYPGYPGQTNFSYISLQNVANCLHQKQKVSLARRVTWLASQPLWC